MTIALRANLSAANRLLSTPIIINSALSYRTCRRTISMSSVNYTPTAPAAALNGDSALIPFSSRLRTGRALAVDVWSIFKQVSLTITAQPTLIF